MNHREFTDIQIQATHKDKHEKTKGPLADKNTKMSQERKHSSQSHKHSH